MKTIGNNKIIISIVFSIIILIIFGAIYYNSHKIMNENKIMKAIITANLDFSEVSLLRQKAENYYNLASQSYENQDYINTENYCKEARIYYFEESQGYKKIKTELNKEEDKVIIPIYSNLLDKMIEATNNMYEACEHFEVASRFYYKYYNTDVAYDDSSYQSGTYEINAMNEKISSRDKAIEEYNQYLSDLSSKIKELFID